MPIIIGHTDGGEQVLYGVPELPAVRALELLRRSKVCFIYRFFVFRTISGSARIELPNYHL